MIFFCLQKCVQVNSNSKWRFMFLKTKTKFVVRTNHLNIKIKSASFILKLHRMKNVENLTTNQYQWKIFNKIGTIYLFT